MVGTIALVIACEILPSKNLDLKWSDFRSLLYFRWESSHLMVLHTQWGSPLYIVETFLSFYLLNKRCEFSPSRWPTFRSDQLLWFHRSDWQTHFEDLDQTFGSKFQIALSQKPKQNWRNFFAPHFGRMIQHFLLWSKCDAEFASKLAAQVNWEWTINNQNQAQINLETRNQNTLS